MIWRLVPQESRVSCLRGNMPLGGYTAYDCSGQGQYVGRHEVDTYAGTSKYAQHADHEGAYSQGHEHRQTPGTAVPDHEQDDAN
jgi:hypothetical protein